jgi:hypothetical protein
MSTTIVLPERDTLRAQAMKYVVDKIGFNVQPEEPKYDKEEELWRVDCKVSLSNYITNKGKEGKKFVYHFYNVGELLYKEIKGDYILINQVFKSDIEREVLNRYTSLTKEMEKELLLIGSNSWGKLTLVKYYLSPLYAMISNLLDKGYITLSEIRSKKNYKFFKLLLNSGYLNIEESNKTSYIMSNKFEKLKEKQYELINNLDIFGITEGIVGRIFGEHYEIIKDDFGIRPPTSYVDTTKAYYFDALRYGDIIKLKDKDILYSLSNFDGSLSRYDYMNFKKSLYELVNTTLLLKQEEFYYGNENIYDSLYRYRDSLLSGGSEI